MHRLLLRPVTRAIRVQSAASTSRNVIRAISTTPRTTFAATGSVSSSKKDSLDAAFFDAVLGEAEAETKVEGDKPQPEKSEAKTEEPVATQAPQQPARPSPIENAPTEHEQDTTLFDADEFGQDSEAPFEPLQVDTFEPDQYFSEWVSENARATLEAKGTTQLDYICSLLETDATLNALGSFQMEEAEEFERLFALYERTIEEDPQAVVPLLSFFLRRGLSLRPPVGEVPSGDEGVNLVDPKIVEKAFESVDQSIWRITDDTKVEKSAPKYPDLMKPDPLLDPRDEVEFPPEPDTPFHNRVIVRNHRSVFHKYDPEVVEDDLVQEDELDTDNANQDADNMLKALTVPPDYYRNLHQSILMRRTVVQQTGKGKIRRIAFMVLVGDGNGLVGYGEGKHGNGATALKMARLAAVRNMDWVERFEKRTIWTEMQTKLGATQIIMRPRPVGFGLRCNPYLHQILRAAGFKDISAKVWGSRNRLNVIKAAFRMLHAGHAPTGMGDGVGGKGKKLSKGHGVKGKAELERARGRKLISLRK